MSKKDDIVAKNVAKWQAERKVKASRELNGKVKNNGLAFDAIKDALKDAIDKSKGD